MQRERHLNTKEVQLSAWASIERFQAAETIPQGYLVVRDNGIPIDLFYRDADSDTLIVCFHGAAPEDVRIPWHVGAQVVREAGAKRLSISDPSLHLYAKARNTWFAGSESMPSLQNNLSAIIRKVINTAGVENVIFFGGSSGGFAALYYSYQFPNSLALPMNPQTVLAIHHEYGRTQFLENLWPRATSINDLPDTVTTDLAAMYRDGFPNTVGYIQNLRDTFHILNHQAAFAEAVGNAGHAWIYEDAWGKVDASGHLPPPKEFITNLLTSMTASQGQWDKALATLGFNPWV